eukprot:scaffold88981_cov32-Tisochrysis_lutea.AAC.10
MRRVHSSPKERRSERRREQRSGNRKTSRRGEIHGERERERRRRGDREEEDNKPGEHSSFTTHQESLEEDPALVLGLSLPPSSLSLLLRGHLSQQHNRFLLSIGAAAGGSQSTL